MRQTQDLSIRNPRRRKVTTEKKSEKYRRKVRFLFTWREKDLDGKNSLFSIFILNIKMLSLYSSYYFTFS